jgi:hypothetical protein
MRTCECKVPQTLYRLKEPSPFPFIVYNHFVFSVEPVKIKSLGLKLEVKALSYAE